MLRIVLHTVPRVGRSYEHFPDGFELHLLLPPIHVAAVEREGNEFDCQVRIPGLAV
jgi:hypothetical protein